ncbi:MAG TPA: choice-of-anchor tandem repeat GloVer-containing protein [Rhizomicrobium sp.]|nr:choice-of-anchor tandem repeat GloVer-containing protein [Rhizomicrobium sp.]
MTQQHNPATKPPGIQSIGMVAWIAFAVCGLLPFGSAHAWSFKQVHLFCRQISCIDGEGPQQKLLVDATGNLYGTADGGANQHGIVFMLSPKADEKGWAYKVLYHFCHLANCKDGASPGGSWLIRDVAGSIYGTTSAGGKYGNGTIFRLSPAARGWSFDVLYSFCRKDNCADGKFPSGGLSYVGMASGAPYDGTSALYGVASQGGKTGGGVAYSLTPQPDAAWSETALYAFCRQKDCKDGLFPQGGTTPDADGNLFGATFGGGGRSGQGVAYKLAQDVQLGAWQETVLHRFCTQQSCADGYPPISGLVLDSAGNLFGTSQFGGTIAGCPPFNSWCGVVFKIAPDGTFSDLHDFCSENSCVDGAEPINQGGLILDGAGNLYGTTNMCGFTCVNGWGGTVFKLSGNTLETLYSFCQVGNCEDGSNPTAGLVQDAAGNLFGTTSGGGINGYYGTVFEISP